MAFNGGSFKDAFSFFEITKKIRQIGLKRLMIGYLFVIVGGIGGRILVEIIGSFNIIGLTIAQLIVAPYILMFSARFSALIYRINFLFLIMYDQSIFIFKYIQNQD